MFTMGGKSKRKTILRKYGSMALVLLLVAALAGCGSSGDDGASADNQQDEGEATVGNANGTEDEDAVGTQSEDENDAENVSNEGANGSGNAGDAGNGDANNDGDDADGAGTDDGDDADASNDGDGANGGDASGAGTDNGDDASDDGAAGSGSANGEDVDDGIRLKDVVPEKLGGYIGTCVTSMDINNEDVWNIVTTQFNAVTFGNELKPDSMFGYSNAVCPGTTEVELNGETLTVPKMNFIRADTMLDKIKSWNEQNPDDTLKVRGHVLVWHSQTPEWFFHVDYDKNKDYVDKDTMNKRLEWYIRTMLTHYTGEDSPYKGMFYGWDVVNEAISDATGTYRTDTENSEEPLSNDTHGNNSSWWHVYQSNEFIINAFVYANKYAPADLELYYNDYNASVPKKEQGILELLNAVKSAEGTRIDAMGMQGHFGMDWTKPEEIDTAIHDYAEVVGNVQLTEVDMKASSAYDGTDATKEAEYERQAERYAEIYDVLKAAKAEDGIPITSLTFWGTADHLSWLQSRSNIGGGNTTGLPECPLLFDENFQKKPAFYVFTK